MLQINDKTFMNLQEAVQWLLDNNALPFQSSANYVANTEIGLGTIVNPSPAKVRIGSLIFFADSKVSTVIGVTSNSFIVSDQYNDLVDDVVHVTNISLNASGHLIVTLSNGVSLDAGLIKQVTGMSINSSQHLIVNYNDSSTTDLGPIFSGNVNIDGNFTANSIIENMTGYSYVQNSKDGITLAPIYCGAVKNGNKLTLVIFGKAQRTGDVAYDFAEVGFFTIPKAVADKIYPTPLGNQTNAVLSKTIQLFSGSNSKIDCNMIVNKFISGNQNKLQVYMYGMSNLQLNTEYQYRIEMTFLLSDNLVS